MNGYNYDREPVKRWYDWLFIMTVGMFSGAIVFTVVDSILLTCLGRVIAAFLVGGCIGLFALSVAEDIDLSCRMKRKDKEDEIKKQS